MSLLESLLVTAAVLPEYPNPSLTTSWLLLPTASPLSSHSTCLSTSSRISLALVFAPSVCLRHSSSTHEPFATCNLQPVCLIHSLPSAIHLTAAAAAAAIPSATFPITTPSPSSPSQPVQQYLSKQLAFAFALGCSKFSKNIPNICHQFFRSFRNGHSAVRSLKFVQGSRVRVAYVSSRPTRAVRILIVSGQSSFYRDSYNSIIL